MAADDVKDEIKRFLSEARSITQDIEEIVSDIEWYDDPSSVDWDVNIEFSLSSIADSVKEMTRLLPAIQSAMR